MSEFKGSPRMHGDEEARRSARRVRTCAAELLLELGIAPHHVGYTALFDGAMLLSAQPQTRRVSLTDTVYPLVERFSGEDPMAAEHAIRDAIRLCWQKDAGAFRDALFPPACTPTNADVLYTLSAYLKRQ